MTAAFDTLAYAKRLKDAGFPESQAEGQTLALVEALKEGAGELATKQDISDLRHEMREQEERTRGRFTLLQWMLGFDLALTAAVLWLLLRQASVF